jgi:hypothetical protein
MLPEFYGPPNARGNGDARLPAVRIRYATSLDWGQRPPDYDLPALDQVDIPAGASIFKSTIN